MKNVNITKAKSHLSAILKEVVDNDEEIIISKGGDPIAKIIKYKKKKEIQRTNIFRGQIVISNNFENWPDDIAQSLGIKD